MALEQAIADLLARQDITEVLYRIARGTDRGDLELFASGFHEDGEDWHGLANGPVANIVANLGRSTLLLTQHALSNVLIELDGERARVESLFISFHQRRDEAGQLWDETLRGRYLDLFERRHGVWKIARRVVVWDASRVEPAAASWFDLMRQRPGAEDRYIFGRRDKSDMVYSFELPAELREGGGVNVFILDEIEVRPGGAEAYRRAYAERYLPGAQRRGMRLAGAWQTPPLEVSSAATTLFYLWAVDGVAGWWRQRMSKLPDGSDERFEKLAWWQESDTMTLSRKRRMLCDQPPGQ